VLSLNLTNQTLLESASAGNVMWEINPDLPSIYASIKSHTVSGEDIIFDNGGPSNEFVASLTALVHADDFSFSEDKVLKDVHFWTQENGPSWDGTLEYFVFLDEGGLPGALLAFGNGENVEKTDEGFNSFGGDRFEYSFDLEEPLMLDGGTTYWIGLHLQSDFANVISIKWESSCINCGGNAARSTGGTFDNWLPSAPSISPELAFFLTGGDPTCGEGTKLGPDDLCVPDFELVCGEKTMESDGQCVPDFAKICGAGTAVEDMMCVVSMAVGGTLVPIEAIPLLVGIIGSNSILVLLLSITVAGVAAQIGWSLYKKRKF